MDFTEKFNLITTHIEDNIGLKSSKLTSDIAHILGVTPRTLNEGFQFVTGISLSSYIRLRRVIRTLEEWTSCTLPLTIISRWYGFPDQPTFSKACKKMLGISPSEITLLNLSDYPPLKFEDVLADSAVIPSPRLDKLSGQAPLDTIDYYNT